MTKRTHGHTKSGTPIDDEMIAALVEEAERGFDPDQLRTRPRGRGRPPLGEAARTVESVRLDSDMREAMSQRAAADGVTVSEVIRRALRKYLRSA